MGDSDSHSQIQQLGYAGIPSTSLTSNEIDRIPNSWTLHQVDVNSPGLPRLSSPGWNRSPCPPAFGHHTSAQRALDPLEHLSCKSKSAKSATTSITSFQKKMRVFRNMGPIPPNKKKHLAKRCKTMWNPHNGSPMFSQTSASKLAPKMPTRKMSLDPIQPLICFTLWLGSIGICTKGLRSAPSTASPLRPSTVSHAEAVAGSMAWP